MPRVFFTLAMAALLAASAPAVAKTDYPGSSVVPRSQPGWEKWVSTPEPAAPLDEAKGGRTREGTEVTPRIEACFPTEPRNLFYQVDQVVGPDGKLRPINFLDDKGRVSAESRLAIQGQNTWMLWGEGNEAFWGWLQQHGYGLADFLILIDSRKRGQRFGDAGMINQPGMKAQTDPAKKILGLYLDQADGNRIGMEQPPSDIDAASGQLAKRPGPPSGEDRTCAQCHAKPLFEPGDAALYHKTLAAMPRDGVDYSIYGYPSGVVGLRLMLNPDFFGKGPAAKRARDYWQARVVEQGDDNFYTDTAVHADPELVRPFRVSMTCAFCHIGPHPLSPPADPENPEWSNMSGIIGDQYWTPTRTFSNLRKANSFLYQFIASQQPGTIDTSLVSTDHINNANTIISIYEVGSRLARAGLNPPEKQSAASLTLKSLEDGASNPDPRHTPRVLIDGADSVGVYGALARVYLNIGAYSEQWGHLHNPIVGFKPQRPFELATIRAKSTYWNTAEAKDHRIDQLARFFTFKGRTGESVTQPMKLADAPGGKAYLAPEAADAAKGRGVFVRECALCHSSKQPKGFALEFSADWAKQPVPKAGEGARFFLPTEFAEWDAFRKSAAFQEYRGRLESENVVGGATAAGDPFLKDNYLSTDIRVPVTLVGTNSGRAVATNAMTGQVWANFSSEDYKNLKAVGAVHFYDPYRASAPRDNWGNNSVYFPPRGGPGYYRPASLVSLWATAPYFHNNALGEYTHDPSVAGRLKAFDDGIDKLLWKAKRVPSSTSRPGDLRVNNTLGIQDPGFIYRTTTRSWIDFPGKFIRPLIVGVAGEGLTAFLTCYLWIGLAVVAFILVFVARQRHAGFALAAAAVIAGIVLRGTGIDTVYPAGWWIPVILLAAGLVLWFAPQVRAVAQVFFALLAAGFLLVAGVATAFVDGKLGDLSVGPIPTGTPVNLVMNINPEAPVGALLEAASGMTRGILRIRKDDLQDSDGGALRAFEAEAGPGLMKASKCPDFVLDRGHWFAEGLSDEEKKSLKAFLRTL